MNDDYNKPETITIDYEYKQNKKNIVRTIMKTLLNGLV